MIEQQHQAKEILRRYVQGRCTEDERTWVEAWYKEHYDVAFDIDADLAEEHLTDVWQALEGEMGTKRRWNLRKIAAVAASIALVTGAALLYVRQSTKNITHQVARTMDETEIHAGRDQALLTLADGRTIHLDSILVGGHVAEEGIAITKMDDGTLAYTIKDRTDHSTDQKYNTISTPRGGQYKVVLPDNSVVCLNAASSLRFPVSFAGENREVELMGEGYFEIAHDKQKPFIVTSADQQTIVKGTKFNITAYPEDAQKTTTLLEGSVLLTTTSDDATGTWLQPNEQAVLQHNIFNKTKVDASEAIAWKNGKFKFNNTPLKHIMRQLARWYDVEVVYLDPMEGVTFTGSISRFDDIQDVLRKISLTESVHLETKGRRIMVKH